VRAFPIQYKRPTCVEDEMYLTFYKKMIEQINKIEEKIEKCKADTVLKTECEKTRLNDKAYFKEIFDSILKELAEVKRDIKDGFNGMNDRILSLEVWRGVLIGGMTIIMISGSIFAWFIDKHDESDAKQFQELKQK
jgi:phage-related protein